MVRDRVAIAHFAETGAAEDACRLLIAQGGEDATVRTDTQAGRTGFCRLEVSLPRAIERQLLDILLGSDALRVDIHDADPETR
jgi:hypothetical protein